MSDDDGIPKDAKPFDAIVVGAGPLGCQTVLEVDRLQRAQSAKPLRILLVDGGDVFYGKQRWTSTGLSAQTVINLSKTGVNFVDGENATYRPDATSELDGQEDHSVEAQLPREIIPKHLQVTFPDLLRTYTPLLRKLESAGSLEIIQGRFDSNAPDALRDLSDGFAIRIQTEKHGEQIYYGRSALYGADGSGSNVRTALGIQMSEPLKDVRIPETIAGFTRMPNAHEPLPGAVFVEWFNERNAPGRGGSVLAKTEHELHVLSTRQTQQSRPLGSRDTEPERKTRLQLITHIARMQGIETAPEHVSHYYTDYCRVNSVVSVGERSGSMFAIGGDAASRTPPLGGFGVNIALSTTADLAARFLTAVGTAAGPQERLKAAHKYRDAVNHVVAKHHSHTFPKFLRFGGLVSPYEEILGEAPHILLDEYHFPSSHNRRDISSFKIL